LEEATETNRDLGEERGPMTLSLGLSPLRLKPERGIGRLGPNTTAAVSPSQESVKPSNLELASPGLAPHLIEDQLLNPSAQRTKGFDNHHQNGGGAKVVQQYLHTMESFLKVQQEVMQTFLDVNSLSNLAPSEIRAAAVGSSLPLDCLEERQNPESEGQGTVPLSLDSGLDRGDLLAGRSVEPTVAGLLLEEGEVVSRLPENPRLSRESISQILLELISERTGYPIHMVGLSQNLEADLGVDSIKRVEILGAFQKETGAFQAQEIERATGFKTAQEIIDLAVRQYPKDQQQGASGRLPCEPGRTLASPVSSSDQTSSLPFIGSPISFVAGRELVALREIEVNEDVFLRDHTLGSRVSAGDPELLALPIVPLTMSMEMMAEAAGSLFPGKLVVGMKDIRAYHWISLDRGRTTLQLVARSKSPGIAGEVEVQITEVRRPGTDKFKPPITIIEGTVVLADTYPEPPPAGEFLLQSERPSKWLPTELYTKGMFHGPLFQGVVSVDRWGEDGVAATLKALPSDQLFSSIPKPRFLADPVLLDAAGQLVGYWTAEHLETGFNVFPFAVEAVEVYGSNLPPGEVAECRARIALVGQSQVRSDIDIIGTDGRFHARLFGWEDKRFNLPDSFYRLRISPRDALLSEPWDSLVALLPQSQSFVGCLLAGFSDDFFESHGKIWQRVLAHLVLSRAERENWHALKGPDKRRNEWLRGRSVAKDAVRIFVKNRWGLQLCPADIEITQDGHGRPFVGGDWTKDLECLPIISLAHTGEVAVAVVGNSDQFNGIGVDIEPLDRMRNGFESVAFNADERRLLSSEDASLKEEQTMRLWCAKEAIAKALGRGLIDGPKGLVAQHLDPGTGVVKATLSGEMARQLPEMADTELTAYTAREGDMIVAGSLCRRT